MVQCGNVNFNIHVNGANHNTRPLNLSQAKTLILAQILQDINTSNPFVCEVTLAAIEPGDNKSDVTFFA